jgi:AraC-like DNA-binding protein
MIHASGPPTHRAGGISAMVVDLSPGLRATGHRHDLFTIVAVLRGELVERRGSRWVTREAGTITIVPRGSVRDLQVHDDGARVAVFSCATGEPLARQPMSPRNVVLADNLRLAESLGRLALLGTRTDGALEHALLTLMAGQGRTDSDAADIPAWVPDVCTALSRANGNLLTRELACHAGRHPVALARDFRRAMGIGLQEYGRRLRLERAVGLLHEPQPGLSTIALEVGFADQSHFTRDFVRRFGVSPGRYRREHRHGCVSSVQDKAFPIANLGDVQLSRNCVGQI